MSDDRDSLRSIVDVGDPRGAGRVAQLERALARATFIAEHLWQMIDPETWRATGGDDGQGHYEGDYRAEQVRDEIRWLAALVDELPGSRAGQIMLTTLPDERWIATLTHHVLVEIRCDHDTSQDMPVCNCALWAGGWHPSVQAAKEAWAAHVWDVLAG